MIVKGDEVSPLMRKLINNCFKSVKEIEYRDLFDIKLLEESEELNEIKGEKKKKPKNRVSLFFSRHKKFFIIFFSSIALVLTIALIIYGVRISSVTKECRKINSQGYYSRQYITDELKEVLLKE